MTGKKYDYWLIVWCDQNGNEVHEPAPFERGKHPKEWCEIMLDRTNNTRSDRSPRYTSYKIFRLILKDVMEQPNHQRRNSDMDKLTFEELSRFAPRTTILTDDTFTDFWERLYHLFKERLEKEQALKQLEES